MTVERDKVFRACPFCGQRDAFVERADIADCYVMCNHCSAHGPTRCDETEADADATENDLAEPGELAAIRAWNTRALLPANAGQPDGGVEELRKAARHALTYIENRFSDLSPEKRTVTKHLRAALAASAPAAREGE